MKKSNQPEQDLSLDPSAITRLEELRSRLAIDAESIGPADLSSASEYKQAVLDGSAQLRRLTSVHEMAETARSALKQLAGSSIFWGCATTSYIAATALLFGTGHDVPVAGRPDFIDFDMLRQSWPSLGAAGLTISAVLASQFDRGYARLVGMSEALKRLDDGADPAAAQLKDRLSVAEQIAYGELLERVYAADSPIGQTDRTAFLDAVHKAIEQAVDSHAGSRRAPEILSLVRNIGAALDNIQSHGQETSRDATHSAVLAPAQPGL